MRFNPMTMAEENEIDNTVQMLRKYHGDTTGELGEAADLVKKLKDRIQILEDEVDALKDRLGLFA
jgi:hypothetical protein